MEGKKKRPLFFLLVLLLSHKANNVLFERMKGILLLECENEYVKNENGYKLATGHHYMDNDQIERWLQGTDRSRRVKIEENVKYKYNVEELNTKYEQTKGKRINRILKESTYEAQNVADNNYIDDKANGEYKTDNKTNKGEGARNMVMLDYDISGSGHPDGIIDNVVELGTEDEGNFLENSSKGGDHPYRMNRKERMCSGVINQTFLQKNVMRRCNNKRKRGTRDWDCPTKKDVCIPDRRYQLCMKELTNLVNNTKTHSHNDITFLKLNLKEKLTYDAAVEGDLLLKKYNNVYSEDLCKDIKWSLEDFGDIIMGTDMEGIGYSQVVENNLRTVFGTGTKTQLDRKKWWNESKKYIWEATILSVKKKLNGYSAWNCKEDVQINVEPQIYRWIREWGMDYMSELPKEQRKIKEKCDRKLYYTNLRICTMSPCNDSCKLYDQWITRKKKQWDVLSTKFSSVKKGQIIETENITTAYDILKQELNGFNEVMFENEINKRDNVYIDICLCAADEPNKNTQEHLKKLKSAPKLETQRSHSTIQPMSSSGAEKVQGDLAHGNINDAAYKSTTDEAAKGDGQNGNQTVAESNIKGTDNIENEAAKNVDTYKFVTERSADTRGATDITETGEEKLNTSYSGSSEITVKENIPGDGIVKDVSAAVENSENPLETKHKIFEPSKDNSDNSENSGSMEFKATSSNPITEAVESSSAEGQVQEDSAHRSVNTGRDNSTISAATSDDGLSSGDKRVESLTSIENADDGGDPVQGSLWNLLNDPSVGAGGGKSHIKTEENEGSQAEIDGKNVDIAEQRTATITEVQPERPDLSDTDNGNVPRSGNKQNEGATALSGAESLESNESVHKTIDNTTHGLENKNGGNEKDFQKHDFMNNDMLNDQTSSDQTSSDQTSSNQTSSDQTSSNQTSSDQTSSDQISSDQTSSDQTSSNQTSSDQTIDTEEHHRDNVRNPEIKSSEDMSKGDFMRNSNSNELYSHNNLNNRKLNIDQYEHRDVKATREKIILMSEVNKCNNRASLKYCNTIEDRMLSSTCSRERSKNLCCSISDFCLNYFELYPYEFYNCMKKEFEDSSYECFTKGSSTGIGIVYFATGGAFLIILLLFVSKNVASNDYEEEATFDEFVEYSDDIHRTPLMPNHIEHMQQFTPLDYS
uniref:Duffy receptor beta form n=1 Tax=Plasmodium knowlesi TaxID=5850 RepID=PVDB_PLAKN|nr:RecName: Full=Duffy receptor beta form; AltName: Full=Erythrocyte-binding protein; Flags: Precursor [Plasmodium knowlesi]AAA29603.1 erythrocyte binding protein [Plasmodium knowlesi]